MTHKFGQVCWIGRNGPLLVWYLPYPSYTTSLFCSGALLAARARLLAGRRCTSHHDITAQLRRLAPNALVQEDCIFTNDGNLWTSADITTGLDLCLQLVANQWGHTAVTIARELLLYQRRSGHEPQLSFWLQHRNHIQSRLHQMQDLVMAQPGYPWSVPELAERACVSERHLRRLFLAATGINLQDYLQQARLELARQLLEQTVCPYRISHSGAAFRLREVCVAPGRVGYPRHLPDTEN